MEDTYGQLVSIEALEEAEGEPPKCASCSRNYAVWSARFMKQRTLMSRVPTETVIQVCLGCYSTRRNDVRNKASEAQQFAARRLSMRYKYMGLVRVCRAKMGIVIRDERLRDIYSRINDLGEALNEYDLEYAWKTLK